MNLPKRQIRVTRAVYLLSYRFFFCFLLTLFLSFSWLEANVVFPARGFAKILSDKQAESRLHRYRSFVVRDLNSTDFHSGYAFRFRMRHMPRRGEEFSRSGTIYGLALGHGLSRIDLEPINSVSKKYLFSNGPKPKVWLSTSINSEIVLLEDQKLFDPFFTGMNQSPFDLLMPFVFWEAKYIKSGRVAGRSSHLYSFIPPQWVKEYNTQMKEIVMALDRSYEAPLRIETFSRSSVPSRTFVLNSMKKVDKHWIVKSLDCKNRDDRSNTRFEVTAAALNLDLDFSLLSPGGLATNPVVPEDAFISTK